MQEKIVKQEEQEIDLREIFFVMKRKLWLILLCAVLGATLMFFYTKKNTVPTYSATAKLYIFSDTQISSAGISLTSELAVDFIHLAKSRTVMEEVIADQELESWTSSRLASCVSVSNPEESHLLVINVRTTNPTLSMNLANSMARVVADNVAKVMNTDRPRIMEEAIAPTSAVDSGLKRKTVLGGLIGAVLMMGIIFLAYILDDTVKDEEDVEKYLGVRTLASFPKRSKKHRSAS